MKCAKKGGWSHHEGYGCDQCKARVQAGTSDGSSSAEAYTSEAQPVSPVLSGVEQELVGLGVRTIPYRELEQVTNNFHEACKLGEGGFGEVYKAVWKYKDVAVKRLFVGAEGTANEDRQAFLNEARTLADLRDHPNIVQLMGYSSDGPALCLIFPYAEHGSLALRIRNKGDDILGATVRVQLLHDVACGLKFIHKMGHVHRDIKSANVLLDRSDRARISDFGTVRSGTSATTATTRVSHKSETIIGTAVYMAPEAFTGNYSDKSDIYAFGVVCLEVLTGLNPAKSDGRNNLVTQFWEAVDDEIEGMSGLLEDVWKASPKLWKPLVSLAAECLEMQRKMKRPTASQAISKLEKVLPSLQMNETRSHAVDDDELSGEITKVPTSSMMDDSEKNKQIVRASPSLDVPNDSPVALSGKSIVLQGGRVIRDVAGAPRVRIPSEGVSATLVGEVWHKGLDISAAVVALTAEMFEAASSPVNLLSGGECSTILLAGAAVTFEPTGTRFVPDVALALPLSKSFREDLSKEGVDGVFCAFRWSKEAKRWEQAGKEVRIDDEEGSLYVESAEFSTWSAGLVPCLIGAAVAGSVFAATMDRRHSEVQLGVAVPKEVGFGDEFWVQILAYINKENPDLEPDQVVKFKSKVNFILGQPDSLQCALECNNDSFKITSKENTQVLKWDGRSGMTYFEAKCFESAKPEARTLKATAKSKDGKEAHLPFSIKPVGTPGFDRRFMSMVSTSPNSTQSWLSSSESSRSSIVSSNQERYLGFSSPHPHLPGSSDNTSSLRNSLCKFVVFSCKVGSDADVHYEAKKIKKIFSRQSMKIYQIETEQFPSKEDIKECIDRCATENLVGLHFAGHTLEGEVVLEGKISRRKRAPLPEAFSCVSFISQIEHGATKTLRFVFLNACESVGLGRKLIENGIAYVVCWLDAVPDNKALKFCKAFYETLVKNQGEYGVSFVLAASILTSQLGPCLLWKDGGEDAPLVNEKWVDKKGSEGACVCMGGDLKVFASVEEMMREVIARGAGKPPMSGDEESSESYDDEDEEKGELRSLNNAKGEAEMNGFVALGFDLKFKGQKIQTGLKLFKEKAIRDLPELAAYGLEYLKGYEGTHIIMSNAAVQDIFKGNNITYCSEDLWGEKGILVQKAQAIQDLRARKIAVNEAVLEFEKSLSMRKPKGAGKGNSGHDHMRKMIEVCIDGLRKAVEVDVGHLSSKVQNIFIAQDDDFPALG